MKPRTVITLWLVAIVLAVTIFVVKQSDSGSRRDSTKRSPGQTLLEEFPVEKTANIEITGAEKSVTLTKKDGSWSVSQRDGYPANPINVNTLLRSLAELTVTQGIQAGPSFAPRFGMDEKSTQAETRGVTASFKDADGKNLALVSFGKNLESSTAPSPYGGAASGRYVRNHADESGFYAVSELFSSLSDQPKNWLAEDFLNITKIKTISVSQAGSEKNEWELSRADEAADFTFSNAFPGLKVDSTAAAPLKTLLASASFEDLVPAAEIAARSTAEKLQKAIITTFDGFTYTLTLQPEKGSDNFLLSFTVTAELAKERVKAKDEKPEEAEAAQKAFEASQKALAESLAKTKKLEVHTFVVSKTSIDALLKTRTELIDKGKGPEAQAPQQPNSQGAVYSPAIELPAQANPK
jgi:hypothetical protein